MITTTSPSIPMPVFTLHPLLKDEIHKCYPDFPDTSNELPLAQRFIVPLENAPIEQNILSVVPWEKEDSSEGVVIPVPSLSALFRGTLNPGDLGNTEIPKYMYIIAYIENQWISLAQEEFIPIPRDAEMHEIYSALRRRPDGHPRIPSNLYSIIWQLFAFMAATMEISEAEFTSITSRLIRSASTFKTHITSSNMFFSLLRVYNKD